MKILVNRIPLIYDESIVGVVFKQPFYLSDKPTSQMLFKQGQVTPINVRFSKTGRAYGYLLNTDVLEEAKTHSRNYPIVAVRGKEFKVAYEAYFYNLPSDVYSGDNAYIVGFVDSQLDSGSLKELEVFLNGEHSPLLRG